MISLQFWITMLNHFANLPTMLVLTKLHRTVTLERILMSFKKYSFHKVLTRDNIPYKSCNLLRFHKLKVHSDFIKKRDGKIIENFGKFAFSIDSDS